MKIGLSAFSSSSHIIGGPSSRVTEDISDLSPRSLIAFCVMSLFTSSWCWYTTMAWQLSGGPWRIRELFWSRSHHFPVSGLWTITFHRPALLQNVSVFDVQLEWQITAIGVVLFRKSSRPVFEATELVLFPFCRPRRIIKSYWAMWDVFRTDNSKDMIGTCSTDCVERAFLIVLLCWLVVLRSNNRANPRIYRVVDPRLRSTLYIYWLRRYCTQNSKRITVVDL